MILTLILRLLRFILSKNNIKLILYIPIPLWLYEIWFSDVSGVAKVNHVNMDFSRGTYFCKSSSIVQICP